MLYPSYAGFCETWDAVRTCAIQDTEGGAVESSRGRAALCSMSLSHLKTHHEDRRVRLAKAQRR
jgi:hypothetical protein